MSTYYVDNLLGADTNPGTLASPFKTLRAAVAASQPATIWIKANDGYAFTADDQGTTPIDTFAAVSGRFRKIAGYTTTPGDGGIVTFDVSGLSAGDQAIDPPIAHSGTWWAQFQNLRFEDPGLAKTRNGIYHAGTETTSGYCLLENCHFSGLNYGFSVDSRDGSWEYSLFLFGFDRCSGADCNAGVFLGDPMYSAQVQATNCSFDRCGYDTEAGTGRHLHGLTVATGFTWILNTVFRDCVRGCMIDYFTKGLIANNSFMRCSEEGLEVFKYNTAAGLLRSPIRNNLFQECGYGIRSYGGTADYSLAGDTPVSWNAFYDNTHDTDLDATVDFDVNTTGTDPLTNSDGRYAADTPCRSLGGDHPGFETLGSWVGYPITTGFCADVSQGGTVTVEVERPTITVGDSGEAVQTWATHLSSLSCRMRTLTGRESDRLSRVGVQATHRLYVFGSIDILPKDRVILSDRTLEVRYVHDVDQAGRLLQIELLELT